MGEVIIKKKICDRCHKEVEQFVRGSERGPTSYTVSMSEDFGVAGGTPIHWKELCRDCNSHAAKILRVEVEAQRDARTATGASQ